MFYKDHATQVIKDIFATSTKYLDQMGRTGAFNYIVIWSCCMKDTGLHEQSDKWGYYALPVSGNDVFGKELENMIKDKKDKIEQVKDLTPDLNKKRNMSSNFTGSNKKQNIEKASEK